MDNQKPESEIYNKVFPVYAGGLLCGWIMTNAKNSSKLILTGVSNGNGTADLNTISNSLKPSTTIQILETSSNPFTTTIAPKPFVDLKESKGVDTIPDRIKFVLAPTKQDDIKRDFGNKKQPSKCCNRHVSSKDTLDLIGQPMTASKICKSMLSSPTNLSSSRLKDVSSIKTGHSANSCHRTNANDNDVIVSSPKVESENKPSMLSCQEISSNSLKHQVGGKHLTKILPAKTAQENGGTLAARPLVLNNPTSGGASFVQNSSVSSSSTDFGMPLGQPLLISQSSLPAVNSPALSNVLIPSSQAAVSQQPCIVNLVPTVNSLVMPVARGNVPQSYFIGSPVVHQTIPIGNTRVRPVQSDVFQQLLPLIGSVASQFPASSVGPTEDEKQILPEQDLSEALALKTSGKFVSMVPSSPNSVAIASQQNSMEMSSKNESNYVASSSSVDIQVLSNSRLKDSRPVSVSNEKIGQSLTNPHCSLTTSYLGKPKTLVHATILNLHPGTVKKIQLPLTSSESKPNSLKTISKRGRRKQSNLINAAMISDSEIWHPTNACKSKDNYLSTSNTNQQVFNLTHGNQLNVSSRDSASLIKPSSPSLTSWTLATNKSSLKSKIEDKLSSSVVQQLPEEENISKPVSPIFLLNELVQTSTSSVSQTTEKSTPVSHPAGATYAVTQSNETKFPSTKLQKQKKHLPILLAKPSKLTSSQVNFGANNNSGCYLMLIPNSSPQMSSQESVQSPTMTNGKVPTNTYTGISAPLDKVTFFQPPPPNLSVPAEKNVTSAQEISEVQTSSSLHLVQEKTSLDVNKRVAFLPSEQWSWHKPTPYESNYDAPVEHKDSPDCLSKLDHKLPLRDSDINCKPQLQGFLHNNSNTEIDAQGNKFFNTWVQCLQSWSIEGSKKASEIIVDRIKQEPTDRDTSDEGCENLFGESGIKISAVYGNVCIPENAINKPEDHISNGSCSISQDDTYFNTSKEIKCVKTMEKTGMFTNTIETSSKLKRTELICTPCCVQLERLDIGSQKSVSLQNLKKHFKLQHQCSKCQARNADTLKLNIVSVEDVFGNKCLRDPLCSNSSKPVSQDDFSVESLDKKSFVNTNLKLPSKFLNSQFSEERLVDKEVDTEFRENKASLFQTNRKIKSCLETLHVKNKKLADSNRLIDTGESILRVERKLTNSRKLNGTAITFDGSETELPEETLIDMHLRKNPKSIEEKGTHVSSHLGFCTVDVPVAVDSRAERDHTESNTSHLPKGSADVSKSNDQSLVISGFHCDCQVNKDEQEGSWKMQKLDSESELEERIRRLRQTLLESEKSLSDLRRKRIMQNLQVSISEKH